MTLKGAGVKLYKYVESVIIRQREKFFLNDTDLTVNWNNMQSEIIFRNTYFYLYLQQQLNCQVTR